MARNASSNPDFRASGSSGHIVVSLFMPSSKITYTLPPDGPSSVVREDIIWHTTGSDKTLTSFKASALLKDNPKAQMLRAHTTHNKVMHKPFKTLSFTS